MNNTCKGFLILAKTSTDGSAQLSDRWYKARNSTASSGGCRQPVSFLIWMISPRHPLPLTHPFSVLPYFSHTISLNSNTLQCHPFSTIYCFCLTRHSNVHIAVDAILALNPQTIPETIHAHFLDSDAPWEGYVWKSILKSIQMILIGIYLIILNYLAVWKTCILRINV